MNNDSATTTPAPAYMAPSTFAGFARAYGYNQQFNFGNDIISLHLHKGDAYVTLHHPTRRAETFPISHPRPHTPDPQPPTPRPYEGRARNVAQNAPLQVTIQASINQAYISLHREVDRITAALTNTLGREPTEEEVNAQAINSPLYAHLSEIVRSLEAQRDLDQFTAWQEE